MLDVIKLNFIKGGNFTEKLSDKFKTKGLLGSFLLGALFALAFCPYSGALFFAMLIPMTLSASVGLALPVVFSLGTGFTCDSVCLCNCLQSGKIRNVFQGNYQS